MLTIFGVGALAYRGITYTTTEKAVDIGPLQVNTEQRHTIPMPPLVGGAALLGGVALLFLSGKRA